VSKRVCPNSPEHKEFVTTVHVTEEWVVDEEGNFLDIAHGYGPRQTTHGPNPGNVWVCAECGNDETIEEK
tara:strand:+ start:3658 stop:3867 length:210 start_codon:yes stop_codon:yes gene_type:complete